GLGDTLWLAVEVSKVVDRVDVERARRRADLLQQAGFPSIAVAAGEEATFGCDKAAQDIGVVLIQDGSLRFWDEAVKRLRRDKGAENVETA
ncbi:MAG: hypothetical protein N2439_05190, partial [Anaerolineae bacterium]|nr:hypothetical protein [Anaerolineae bacterium]